ncbi:MAG: hypothetical protein R3344_01335 [Acidobacteriota bacterium]|nr:hypothetical protein [Acidobacteriota bacterium]
MWGSLRRTVNVRGVCLISVALLVVATLTTVVLADNTLTVFGVAGCEPGGTVSGSVTVGCDNADFTVSIPGGETITQIDLWDAAPTAGCAAGGGASLIETLCTGGCPNGTPFNVTTLTTTELLGLFDGNHHLEITGSSGTSWGEIDNGASKDPPGCLTETVPAMSYAGMIALIVLILIGGGWILLRR